MDSYTQQ